MFIFNLRDSRVIWETGIKKCEYIYFSGGQGLILDLEFLIE